MKKLYIPGIFLALVLICSSALGVPTVWVDDDYNAGNAGGHTWGVDAFDNINAGLVAADSGGTINVAAGNYIEILTIIKPVTILGPQANVDPRTGAGLRTPGSANEAVVDVGGATFAVLVNSSDVTINGMEFMNTTDDCIYSEAGISGSTISFCIIHDSQDECAQFKNAMDCVFEFNLGFEVRQDGFSFANSNDCIIRNCEVHTSNSDNGAIYTYSSYGITIEGNHIHNCTASNGIKVYEMFNTLVKKTHIRGNIIEDCDFQGKKYNQDGCGILLYRPQEYMGGTTEPAILVEGNTIQNITGNGRGQAAGTAGHGVFWLTSHITGVNPGIPMIVEGNHILNNGGWGIMVVQSNTADLVDHFSARHNFIKGNAMGGINNTIAGKTVDAIMCYWGDPDGPKAGDTAGSVTTDPWSYFTPVYKLLESWGGMVDLNILDNPRYMKHKVTLTGMSDGSMVRLRTPADRHGLNNSIEILLDPGVTLTEDAQVIVEYKFPADRIEPYTWEQLRLARWDGSQWEIVPGSTNAWPQTLISGKVSGFSIFGAYPDAGTVPVELSVFSME